MLYYNFAEFFVGSRIPVSYVVQYIACLVRNECTLQMSAEGNRRENKMGRK
jgi:hypothetical protein